MACHKGNGLACGFLVALRRLKGSGGGDGERAVMAVRAVMTVTAVVR